MKERLKPRAYILSEEGFIPLTACLLFNEPASCSRTARLSASGAEPKRKRVSTGRPVVRGRHEALVIYPWPG